MKIAHCVGDVDKITLSENLGASALGAGTEDRGLRRPVQRKVGGSEARFTTRSNQDAANHQHAEIFTAVFPRARRSALEPSK